MAALHPDRVLGLAFVNRPSRSPRRGGRQHAFTDRLDTTEGWAKFNQHFWRAHYQEFARFFMEQAFTEPHSTKPIEDTVGWALETDPETLILTVAAIPAPQEADRFRARCQQIACPTVVIVGDDDAVVNPAQGQALAEVTAGSLVTVQGGVGPPVRDSVLVNRLLRHSRRLHQTSGATGPCSAARLAQGSCTPSPSALSRSPRTGPSPASSASASRLQFYCCPRPVPGAGGEGERFTRRAWLANESAHIERVVRAACTPSSIRMWTRSCWALHCVDDCSTRTYDTGNRDEPRSSTIPTEPRTQADRVFLADRLFVCCPARRGRREASSPPTTS